jgi:hypothetical protein
MDAQASWLFELTPETTTTKGKLATQRKQS